MMKCFLLFCGKRGRHKLCIQAHRAIPVSSTMNASRKRKTNHLNPEFLDSQNLSSVQGPETRKVEVSMEQ